jgi:hypothetical protein
MAYKYSVLRDANGEEMGEWDIVPRPEGEMAAYRTRYAAEVRRRIALDAAILAVQTRHTAERARLYGQEPWDIAGLQALDLVERAELDAARARIEEED